MNNLKAVILDLDGTLANTLPDLLTGMNLMLAFNDFPLTDVNGILRAINYGSYEFVKRCLPESKRDDDFVSARLVDYSRFYSKHYMEKTVAYDGMNDVLRALKADGFKLGVLSNKRDDHCNALVRHLFGDELFDFILGQTDFLPTKPDPTPALYVAEKLGVKPGEVAYVGDSHIDMKTGKGAGMFTIGVSWGYRSVDILLENGADMIANTRQDLLKIKDL